MPSHLLAGGTTFGVSTGTVALLAIGVLAVAGALLWRGSVALRVRHSVRTALQHESPAARIDAVRQAGELGLAASALPLLRLVRDESDQQVLTAVVRVVAERQWEPASTPRLVELRLWARAYLERHPELRGANNTSEPLLAGVPGSVGVPSLDPARAERFKRNSDTVHETDTPTPPRLHVADADALSPVRVVVTGAGGPAGVAVIEALRARGHHVIAVDADPMAVGLRLAAEGHVVPRCDDPAYLAALLRAATLGNAQALICTVAEEYPALIAGKQYLDEAAVRTLFPSRDTVHSCTDKWAFAESMRAAGLPTPDTELGGAGSVAGPWVVKPRYGRGSRDIWTCRTKRQLAAALSAVPEPLVQGLVIGREFTCDALMDTTGALAGASPRWRLETKAGISTKGETFEHAEVMHVCEQVLKAVRLIGPANVQGFVTGEGNVVIHEVNPRFAGGLPLSLHAGADLVEEYLRAVLGLPVRPERLIARPGVTMLRYFREVFAE
ncbi:MAG TPA: ATP-grasp domain-containing protein [Mycobacteriales bacterium]|jgi:carbamoyl-phosphate synthase large subunit|nr:ATP-grasp domain-containing protein [Mycobacteriales bacterium]